MAAVDGNHTSIYNDPWRIPRSDKKEVSIEEAVELVTERINPLSINHSQKIIISLSNLSKEKL